MSNAGGGDLQFQSKDLVEVVKRLKGLENGKELQKASAKELRAIVKKMTPAVRSAIRGIPSHQRGRRKDGRAGLRQSMSKATKAQVSVSQRKVVASIRVDGRKMPTGMGAIPKYVEGTKAPFRHPLFGEWEYPQTQRPHPYFYQTVKKYEAEAQRDIERVFDTLKNAVES